MEVLVVVLEEEVVVPHAGGVVAVLELVVPAGGDVPLLVVAQLAEVLYK